MSKQIKKTQDQMLIEIMKSKQYAVDQHGNVYVKIEDDCTKGKFFPVNAEEFQQALTLSFGNDQEQLLNIQKAKSAANFATAYGKANGKSVHAAQRFATIDNIEYIDVSDSSGNAIKVTTNGFEITQNVPIIFRHLATKLPIVVSEEAGDPKLFLKYAHCRDEEQEMLLLVDLCLSCKSGIDQPPTCFTGAQGSGKTQTATNYRNVFDPTTTQKEDTLNSKEQIALLADSNAMVLLDNVTQFSGSLAEQIKKIVTGCTLQKRQLYSDNKMLQFYLHNKFLITSINVPCRDADFLDRAIIFEFDRFPRSKNKTKTELREDFEQDVPFIRRGCLEALVEAKRIYPSLNLADTSRMADYETWGAAVAVALGYTKEAYVEAFRANQAKYHTEYVRKSDDPLVETLIGLVKTNGGYDGLVSDLLRLIQANAPEENRRGKKWPSNATSLGIALSRIEAELEESGIRLTRVPGRKVGSKVRLEMLKPKAIPCAETSNEIIDFKTGEVHVIHDTHETDFVDLTKQQEPIESDNVQYFAEDLDEDDKHNPLCKRCYEYSLNSKPYDGGSLICYRGREEPRKVNFDYYCPDYQEMPRQRQESEENDTDSMFG